MTYKVDFKSKSVKRAIKSATITVEADSEAAAMTQALSVFKNDSAWTIDGITKVA